LIKLPGLVRLLAIVSLAASTASADVLARVDLGLAQPVSSPASSYFGTGFDSSVALSADVASFLDLGGRLSYIFVSQRAGSPLSGPASLIAVGAAARAHRPREEAKWVPWAELSVQYVRTGTLDRVGLSASVGVQFPLVERFSLGPWLGVEQVFRVSDTSSYPTHDATVIGFGIAGELTLFGLHPSAPRTEIAQAPGDIDLDPDHDGVKSPFDRCPTVPEDRDGFEDDDGCPDPDDDQDGVLDANDACPRVPGSPATLGCPDRDSDGVADADDQCPDVRGLPTEAGCPTYGEVKVGTARIDLLHTIDFPRGASAIPPRSLPMVDELAQALKDRASLCVRVVGKAPVAALASARAEAVMLRLMLQGVSPSRLLAQGQAATTGELALEVVPCEVKTP
jgi:outer membrane protein OmpA-like peptidoglycan-associated protein